MGNLKLNQSLSKTLVNLFIVLAIGIALFLSVGSQCRARPSSLAKFSAFRAENILGSSYRSLGTMLPKGQPVPPSGPSPQIN
ncbi:hypothetical protein ERO13_D12G142400v2 [Gossypium hirsutum]|uniref:Uncharacterized protein n=2 Tax=Gossypium TaxID=3633 RepID=A0A5J5NZ27_GOSBA|nr:hypothetical protein ES319_D12G158600v1 [Gossypium barbadense]KAG4115998.1 hypothetical protein ERO13_D12G142400v2 [Gossypium hirsutum]TYI51221.1 hypothetical protein E1A91_D12G160400v1 [Gossypium mustelinum]